MRNSYQTKPFQYTAVHDATASHNFYISCNSCDSSHAGTSNCMVQASCTTVSRCSFHLLELSSKHEQNPSREHWTSVAILTLWKAKTTFFLVFNFVIDCMTYTIKNCHDTVNLYIPLKMSSSLSEAASWSILEANTSNRSSVPGSAPVSGFWLASEALRGCFMGDVCDISTFDS